VKIIEFPSDVVNSAKNIQFIVVIIYRMSASDCWHIAGRWEQFVLQRLEIEQPQIIEPIFLVFTTENVKIDAISGA
jgi:hypothetical protein